MTHQEYLKLAYLEAKNSPDPSTQNGAILVRDNQIIGRGCNRLPTGVEETALRLERPLKYEFILHAETCAIFDAARNGYATNQAILYCPWAACSNCAKAIIESGISRVYAHDLAMKRVHGSWQDSIERAKEMFVEAGVAYELLGGDFPEIEILFKENKWKPGCESCN